MSELSMETTAVSDTVAAPGTRAVAKAKSAPAGGAAPPQRITVALIPKASADLKAAVARSGMSQTDIVNRAVTLYDFIDEELGSGAEFILRRDGRDHLIKLL